MGESSTSIGNKTVFSRFEAILLSTCTCSLLEHKIFLLGLHIRRLLQPGTIVWLPSVFLLDILVFSIVLLFLTAPKQWRLRTRIAAFVSRALTMSFATFII